MTSVNFAYWLQGFFEITGEGATLTEKQIAIVKQHLDMVFVHEIDPSFPPGQQQALDAAHNGRPNIFPPAPQDYDKLRPRC